MLKYSGIFFFCILSGALLFNKVQSQTVSNVNVILNDKKIEVTYDLEGEGVFVVSLFYADSSGKNWMGPLKFVSGEVGPAQRAGKNKRIIWDADLDVKSIEGFFQFKVLAESTIKETFIKESFEESLGEKPKKILTDLEKRKLTLVMEKTKKGRTPWLIGFLITGGAGAFGYLQTGSLYEKYKTATTDAASLRQTITTLNYATPAALGLAGISFIEFLVKSGKYATAKRALAGTIIKISPTRLGLAYTF
jgi:hypothetical protein